MNLKKLSLATLLFTSIFMLAACHEDDDDETDSTGVTGQVEYELWVTDSIGNPVLAFNQGDVISFEYTVRNDSSEAVNFEFPNGLPLEIQIYKREFGSCIALFWTYSGEFKDVTLPPSELYLEPSEQQTYIIDWDQLDVSDNLVDPGSYCVQVQIEGVAANEGLESEDIDIN